MTGLEWPTASIKRIDVSPGGRRASATPAPRLGLREDPRWNDGKRVEPCACGGEIVQYLGEAVERVVEIHNASTRHQRWRDARPA